MSILVLSQATQKRIDSPKKELTTHDSLEKRLVESILQLSTPNHWHSSNLLIFSQPKETTHTVVVCRFEQARLVLLDDELGTPRLNVAGGGDLQRCEGPHSRCTSFFGARVE